jgi:hypothetical protein
LQAHSRDALDSIAANVIERIREHEPSPADLELLLRQYGRGDRDDAGDVLGEALATALSIGTRERTAEEQAGWLRVFRAALDLSDDERLVSAAGDLAVNLARQTPTLPDLGDACAAIDACLRAADVGDARATIVDAVDQLERVIGRAYSPGEGIADGDVRDHVRAASMLLTAYEITGRLPYAMLAEELMQSSRRFRPTAASVAIQCDAARVFCRLAALHADDDYRRAAVIAEDADYRGDAALMLEALAPRALDADAAAYGLALGEFLALTIESPDAYGH